ncbi:hypothetical protein C2E23DRAFT_935622 [Lenzites betulinus]|nr:hypothetical protein C2E23DRAFT_935622 [Lenzites betulinus]
MREGLAHGAGYALYSATRAARAGLGTSGCHHQHNSLGGRSGDGSGAGRTRRACKTNSHLCVRLGARSGAHPVLSPVVDLGESSASGKFMEWRPWAADPRRRRHARIGQEVPARAADPAGRSGCRRECHSGLRAPGLYGRASPQRQPRCSPNLPRPESAIHSLVLLLASEGEGEEGRDGGLRRDPSQAPITASIQSSPSQLSPAPPAPGPPRPARRVYSKGWGGVLEWSPRTAVRTCNGEAVSMLENKRVVRPTSRPPPRLRTTLRSPSLDPRPRARLASLKLEAPVHRVNLNAGLSVAPARPPQHALFALKRRLTYYHTREGGARPAAAAATRTARGPWCSLVSDTRTLARPADSSLMGWPTGDFTLSRAIAAAPVLALRVSETPFNSELSRERLLASPTGTWMSWTRRPGLPGPARHTSRTRRDHLISYHPPVHHRTEWLSVRLRLRACGGGLPSRDRQDEWRFRACGRPITDVDYSPAGLNGAPRRRRFSGRTSDAHIISIFPHGHARCSLFSVVRRGPTERYCQLTATDHGDGHRRSRRQYCCATLTLCSDMMTACRGTDVVMAYGTSGDRTPEANVLTLAIGVFRLPTDSDCTNEQRAANAPMSYLLSTRTYSPITMSAGETRTYRSPPPALLAAPSSLLACGATPNASVRDVRSLNVLPGTGARSGVDPGDGRGRGRRRARARACRTVSYTRVARANRGASKRERGGAEEFGVRRCCVLGSSVRLIEVRGRGRSVFVLPTERSASRGRARQHNVAGERRSTGRSTVTCHGEWEWMEMGTREARFCAAWPIGVAYAPGEEWAIEYGVRGSKLEIWYQGSGDIDNGPRCGESAASAMVASVPTCRVSRFCVYLSGHKKAQTAPKSRQRTYRTSPAPTRRLAVVATHPPPIGRPGALWAWLLAAVIVSGTPGPALHMRTSRLTVRAVTRPAVSLAITHHREPTGERGRQAPPTGRAESESRTRLESRTDTDNGARPLPRSRDVPVSVARERGARNRVCSFATAARGVLEARGDSSSSHWSGRRSAFRMVTLPTGRLDGERPKDTSTWVEAWSDKEGEGTTAGGARTSRGGREDLPLESSVNSSVPATVSGIARGGVVDPDSSAWTGRQVEAGRSRGWGPWFFARRARSGGLLDVWSPRQRAAGGGSEDTCGDVENGRKGGVVQSYVHGLGHARQDADAGASSGCFEGSGRRGTNGAVEGGADRQEETYSLRTGPYGNLRGRAQMLENSSMLGVVLRAMILTRFWGRQSGQSALRCADTRVGFTHLEAAGSSTKFIHHALD